MKFCHIFYVGSLNQVISKELYETLDTILNTKMSCSNSIMIHITTCFQELLPFVHQNMSFLTLWEYVNFDRLKIWSWCIIFASNSLRKAVWSHCPMNENLCSNHEAYMLKVGFNLTILKISPDLFVWPCTEKSCRPGWLLGQNFCSRKHYIHSDIVKKLWCSKV